MHFFYTLNPWLKKLNNYFTLNNCLFGSVKLTKNADPDKYKCSGYEIGFDSRPDFLFTDESIAKYVIVFGADMSSSVNLINQNLIKQHLYIPLHNDNDL